MQIDSTGAAVLATLNRASSALEPQRVGRARLANDDGPPPPPPPGQGSSQTTASAGVSPGQSPLTPNAVTALQQADPDGNPADRPPRDVPPPAPGAEQPGTPNAAPVGPPPPQEAERGPPPTEEETAETDDEEEAEAAPEDEEGADGLTPQEERQVQELQQRDAEVRRHEQAHAAAGGAYAGAPSYEYQRGPDGRLYAVGGEVSIDSSPVAGDPAATIAKLQQVRRAALAPSEPSPQDQRVAAEATRQIAQARAELRTEQGEARAAEVERREEEAAAAAAERAGDGPVEADGAGPLPDIIIPQRIRQTADVADPAVIAQQTALASPAPATDDSASRSIQTVQAFAAAQSLSALPPERGAFY